MILDRKGKPWLLEVNHAPSFSCGSQLDQKIKLELLRNTMRLIHLQAYHKKKFKQEQQLARQQRMQQVQTRLVFFLLVLSPLSHGSSSQLLH